MESFDTVKDKPCFICKKILDGFSNDAHPYECTYCFTLICEVCHNNRAKYRTNPELNQSNCMGVLCPVCGKRIHFKEL